MNRERLLLDAVREVNRRLQAGEVEAEWEEPLVDAAFASIVTLGELA